MPRFGEWCCTLSVVSAYNGGNVVRALNLLISNTRVLESVLKYASGGAGLTLLIAWIAVTKCPIADRVPDAPPPVVEHWCGEAWTIQDASLRSRVEAEPASIIYVIRWSGGWIEHCEMVVLGNNITLSMTFPGSRQTSLDFARCNWIDTLFGDPTTWAARLSDGTVSSPDNLMIKVTCNGSAFGWPFKALARETTCRERQVIQLSPLRIRSNLQVTASGVMRVKYKTDVVRYIDLPTRVVWPGFLANTVMFGVSGWGIAKGVRYFGIERRRRKAGLCPGCGYPHLFKAGVCSECGATHSAAGE